MTNRLGQIEPANDARADGIGVGLDRQGDEAAGAATGDVEDRAVFQSLFGHVFYPVEVRWCG